MVDFDIEYGGGMALTIEAELPAVSTPLPVTVRITHMAGRVRRAGPPQHSQAKQRACSPLTHHPHLVCAPLRLQLRVRVPRPQHGTEFHVTFVTAPAFALAVQSRLPGSSGAYALVRDRLDPYLARKLKALFLEMWTLPAWRFFDLPLISLPTYVHVRVPPRPPSPTPHAHRVSD
jgi:hypothetical protein